jgi:diacylglycerol diphosphate phosphatase/phosphatidate phosphatase
MPENNPRNERVKSRMAPNENGLYETLQRVWQRHRGHAGDYIGLFILIIIYIVVRSFNDPFHSQFRLDDPRIQHPHAEVERVGVGS